MRRHEPQQTGSVTVQGDRAGVVANVCVPFNDEAAHAHGAQEQRAKGAYRATANDDDVDLSLQRLLMRHLCLFHQ